MTFAGFCSSCQAIQLINPTINYFSLFRTEPKYAVDVIALEKKFKDAQKLLHPDKYVNKSIHEKNLSTENSTMVNKAFEILKSDIERAGYLLSQNGITDLEEGKNSSNSLLMNEMFELREELEETQNTKELGNFLQRLYSLRRDLHQELANYFDTEGNLEKATTSSIRMKYICKAIDEAEEKKALLSPS